MGSQLAIISLNTNRLKQALELEVKEGSDIYSEESINKYETIYSGVSERGDINQISIIR